MLTFLGLLKIVIIFNTSMAKDWRRSDATIEVLSFKTRKVTKRDIPSYNEQHDYGLIRLNLHAFNITYNLNLKPLASMGSIFSSNFVYNVIDQNPTDGGVFVEDITPSLEELNAIQGTIFTDNKTGSIVTVKCSDGCRNIDKFGNLTKKDIVLNGVVHGGRIKREAGAANHVFELPNVAEQKVESVMMDYVDLKMKLTPRSGSDHTASNKKFTIYPELAIVADYNDIGVGVSELEILEYVTVLIAGVNERYSLTDDPSIICEIVSFHVIKPGSSPAFITTLSATMVNGVPNYDGISLIHSFAKWAKTNQGSITGFGANEHDIMVLITSRKTEMDGRAIFSGACNTNASEHNFATVYGTDVYGSFGGSFGFAIVLAHEIGHNLGASHDGEYGDVRCGKGHIMGDLSGQALDRPVLSSCSLRQIKAFALSTSASCLQIKSGPASNFKAKGHFTITAQRACEMFGSVPGWDRKFPYPWYQGPDDSCRSYLCWDRNQLDYHINLGHFLPINGISCGNGGTGRCKNGFCLGDKHATLNEICRQATGDTNSFYVHSVSHSPCAVNITCNATLIVGEQKLVPIWAHPPTGTICGENGEVCLNRTCTSIVPKPNGKCVNQTGTDDAVQEGEKWDAKKECSTGIRCVFGSEYEWFKKPNNGHDCGDGDGKCFEGKCIPTDGSLRFTVLDACKLTTRDNNARVNFNRFEVGARDILCSKLSCKDTHDRVREAATHTPDGTVCGPLKVCKKGKCIYHLW